MRRPITAASLLALVPIAASTGTAQAASDEAWDAVAQCESGDRNINNSSGPGGAPASTASGHFQILDGTWADFGGLEYGPRAIDATRDEQLVVAERILEEQGPGAWGGCGVPLQGQPATDRTVPANDLNCDDFPDQQTAQAHLDSDSSDPDGLDSDDDGQACEAHFGESTPEPSSEEDATGETAYVTAYSWHDNDPPGSAAIAYPDIRGRGEASGSGTFEDPVTAAVPEGSPYTPGTVLYLPHIQRYVIVEDSCGTSTAAPDGCTAELDVWVDGADIGADAADECMSSITGDFEVVVDPAADLPVAGGTICNAVAPPEPPAEEPETPVEEPETPVEEPAGEPEELAEPETPVEGPAAYTVASGDTLATIAVDFGTTWRALAELNGLEAPWTIYPGQVLRLVPAGQPQDVVHVVQSGEWISTIAQDYGVCIEGEDITECWKPLYEDNIEVVGSNPDLIVPGQELLVSGRHRAPENDIVLPIDGLPPVPPPSVPEVPVVEEATPAADVIDPLPGARFTSPFGADRGSYAHKGQDMAAPIGTAIFAAMGGIVVEAGPATGFGEWVLVRNDDGTSAVYGHVNPLVVTGERVETGDQVATVAAPEGSSTGPHLHLEIHPGAWAAGSQIDPLAWLRSYGVAI